MNRLLISSLAATSLHGLLFLGTFTDPVMRQPRPLSFQKIKISLSTPKAPVPRENTVSPAQVIDEKQIHPPVKKESTIMPPEPPQPIPVEKTIPALRPIKQKKQVKHILHAAPLGIPDKQGVDIAKDRELILENVSTRNETPTEENQETQEQSTYAAGIVVQEAVPLQYTNDPPPYPRAARRRGMEGLVEINILVDRQGRVKEQRLHQSSGYNILDRAALKAVKKWRFDPGVKDGKVCEMWVKVPVRFRLITE